MNRSLRAFAAAAVVVACLGSPAPALPPPTSTCPAFPADNAWHADIRSLPVHPRSAAWIGSLGGATRLLHPDFGPSGEPMQYGIPSIVVGGAHATVPVDLLYEDESDPGPYPLGPDTPIESGSDGTRS